MDELVRWLGVQLDEDERIARAVEDRSAPWDGQWMADGNSAVRTYNGHVLFYRHGSGPLKPGLTDHVAEWDPARVLREIDAKRQILRDLEQAELTLSKAEPGTPPHDLMTGAVNLLRRTVRLHAEVYDQRPGYREEWRP
ncbi:DUF6221 family protein [Streptomyces sp. NPDC001520]|uniref:DUF6221 family protein n=1 Tax=Streptomyces sp. NPDC001520 TaxID=3364581 RepID=UPI00368D90CF